MIAQLQPGDVLIVRDIDQMGRSLVEIIRTVDRLIAMKVQFRSISQPFIDTLSDGGESISKFIALLADQERKRLSRRTKAGLAAARTRGKKGGRPAGIGARLLKKASTAQALYEARKLSVDEIARQLGISKGSLYKLLRHQGVQVGQSETAA